MRLAVVLLVAGCGRYHFAGTDAADAPPDIITGHDEDGDGVPDIIDPCPHVPDSHVDSDGDGIGDDCDPEPSNPRQHLVVFGTMQQGDEPLGIGNGKWVINGDVFAFDGVADGDLSLVQPFTNVRVAMGFDVLSHVGTGLLYQVSMSVPKFTGPNHFVELTEGGTFQVASITYYDGTTYNHLMSAPLPTGLHAGTLYEQMTISAETKTASFDGGWPGEEYHLNAAAPAYTGGDFFSMTIDNMVSDLRYVWIVTW